VSVLDTIPAAVSLVASVPVHPLGEFSKDPKLLSFSQSTKAKILADEVEYKAIRIQNESLKTQCEAARLYELSIVLVSDPAVVAVSKNPTNPSGPGPACGSAVALASVAVSANTQLVVSAVSTMHVSSISVSI
jgi:hypothetical protein